MPRDINELLDQIHRLEDQLETTFEAARKQFHYSVEQGRVRFEEEVRRAHRRYREGLWSYLFHARPLSILTAPVIYGMVVPLVVLDAGMTLYQHICFRAYGIPRVRRRDYFIIDRHRLAYLNPIEKLNCVYCGYGNGLIAYSREIIGRTERYWCPIRHARRVRDAHAHYAEFLDYGDAEAYRNTLQEIRDRLRELEH